MRILLTGAGGAIGIHVIAHICHNTDWEIVATDSFRHKGYFDRIAEACADHPEWRKRISIFLHDLQSPFTEREIKSIGKIDVVLNLASLSDVKASMEDPVTFVRNNTELMLNVLEYARLAKPNIFIQFSTDEVYGPAAKDSKGHKEWERINPSNPYSASKACQEAISIAWWRSFGVPLIITNTMNNFGEMQSPSKFPAMIQKFIQNDEVIPIHAASDGEIGTRYYIHSRNVADAVIFIIKNVPPHLHVFGELDLPVRLNIVGDKQVSNLELVKIIAEKMGKEPKYEMVNYHEFNPGHDIHYGLDGEKLKNLGWKSPLSFDESLNNTIKWQQEHPEWL